MSSRSASCADIGRNMIDATAIDVPPARGARPDARLRRRYGAERRFRLYGIAAVSLAVVMLGVLLASIVAKGYSAFVQTEIALDINFDPAVIDPGGKRDADTLAGADYVKLVKTALQGRFADVGSSD